VVLAIIDVIKAMLKMFMMMTMMKGTYKIETRTGHSDIAMHLYGSG